MLQAELHGKYAEFNFETMYDTRFKWRESLNKSEEVVNIVRLQNTNVKNAFTIWQNRVPGIIIAVIGKKILIIQSLNLFFMKN